MKKMPITVFFMGKEDEKREGERPYRFLVPSKGKDASTRMNIPDLNGGVP